jgi:type 1 fimbria pilin
MMHRFNNAPRCAQLFAWLLLAIVAIGWAPCAAAAPKCTSSSATLNFPGTVTIPNNTAVGSTLATGTANMTFTCSGISSFAGGGSAYIQAGQYLATLDSTNNPAGPGITFATGVSGLAVLVNATPVPTSSEACLACGPTSTAGYQPGSVPGNALGTGSGTVTASYTATLIKTGPIAPGTIPSINLIPFWWFIPGDGSYGTSMSLNANLILPTINLTAPSCTLTAGSQHIAVTLPGVSATSLSTAGQVNGRTAFSIAITGCPTSVNTITTYFYGGNIDTTSGNLLNSSGTATNVEVQLLNGSGGSAAALSAINLAGAQASAQNSSQFNVSGGAATLNYYAQYIASGGAATAGSVSTSVTFTIAYP